MRSEKCIRRMSNLLWKIDKICSKSAAPSASGHNFPVVNSTQLQAKPLKKSVADPEVSLCRARREARKHHFVSFILRLLLSDLTRHLDLISNNHLAFVHVNADRSCTLLLQFAIKGLGARALGSQFVMYLCRRNKSAFSRKDKRKRRPGAEINSLPPDANLNNSSDDFFTSREIDCFVQIGLLLLLGFECAA